ncbi:unnamed protein product [Cylicostephanus goldi]|uniref:Uncharacterized protein n=1 Tax=Cylicostephanus goldi TaxID=71465 RepID=A0A3P6REP8_CYLGO|nr:unnamed protein product [Cylicostephanus goldi]
MVQKTSNPPAVRASPPPENVSDALAGLDINNIASVVVIDDHLVETASVDASEEFEEVLNKRAKKQKALLLQAKLEAEERQLKKGETRKEKQEDENWGAVAEKNRSKQQERKKVETVAPEATSTINSADSSPLKSVAEIHGEDGLKTVWNSAHIAGEKESLEGGPPIIPSPIARPNPRSKSAASDTAPPFQDLVRRQIVELPVSLSSSQPLRGDKYDFTFDPRLHEEQMPNEKVLTSLSTGASSEAGSMTDDFRLKEKLYKVKVWGTYDS